MEIFITLFLIDNKMEGKEKRHDASGSGVGVNCTILPVADTGVPGGTGTSVGDTSRLPSYSRTQKAARKRRTTKDSASPAQSKAAVFWAMAKSCLFS